MSRHEFAAFEKLIEEFDEPEEFIDDSVIEKLPEFLELQDQMRQMLPVRHNVIKKYFEEYKYVKEKRDTLFKLLEKSEE
jgi:predicted house-cleaning noncanonical NTP pyrophosphatase (MazG superfamily)